MDVRTSPAAVFGERSPSAGVFVVAAAVVEFVRLEFGVADVAEDDGFSPDGVGDVIADVVHAAAGGVVRVRVHGGVMVGVVGVTEE